MEAALLALVVLLGHPTFKAREAAHVRLVKLDSISLSALLAGELSSDPEIASRCRLLIDRWLCRHAEEILAIYLPADGKWPWLCAIADSGGYTYGVRDHPYGCLTDGDHGPDWPLWRSATKAWLLGLIRQRQDVAKWVTVMVAFERKWKGG